ncbi:MAG: carbohydrate binding family 9 domain-containing protein [Acidobacteria bacterium]|nr:carbohydrate binding family 9 domain-containing protein [Acidobacteriota bacterium]
MRWFHIVVLSALGVLPAAAAVQIPAVALHQQLELNEDALRIDDFRQRQPNDGAPASLRTTVYLAYSESALHAVFVCKDDPAKVRAHLSRRESVDGDDLVGIAIDTFHDGRRAYLYYANPLGVQLDGVTTEGQSDDYRFDAVWSSSGQLTQDGYVVRFVIPFRGMRAKTGSGEQWGISLTRRIPRLSEYDTWPRITDRLEAFVPQFTVVNAPARSSSGREVLVNPYGFAARARAFDESVPAMIRSGELRGGLDSKIAFGNGVSVDLTVNPDFSQVESDEPQIAATRRYENYYPEKRPFFLENAAFFQTPERLFFSRRILDPRLGARVTGKLGSTAFGVLVMDDRAPQAQISALRLVREIGKESSAGFLSTVRRTASGQNSVASVDGRWKLSPNWVLAGQAATSTSSEGRSRASGSDLYGEVRYTGYHFTYSSSYRDRSPAFHADVGFIPRHDIRQADTEAAYRWRPEGGLITSFGPSAYAVITYDHAGALQDWSIEVPFTINFRGPSSVSASHIAGAESFAGRTFRRDGNRAVFSTDRWKRVGVTAALASGRAINYYPAQGPPFGASNTDARFEMTFHATSRIRLDETYLYSRLSDSSRTVLDDHIARSKVSLQFTRAASLRVIADYNATLSNPQWMRLERSKRLSMDILFTYLIHPGTALYVGYNDKRENWLWAEEMMGFPSRHGGPSFSSGRQLFIKFNYLFHL